MAKATKKQVLGRGLTSILEDSKNNPGSISNINKRIIVQKLIFRKLP